MIVLKLKTLMIFGFEINRENNKRVYEELDKRQQDCFAKQTSLYVVIIKTYSDFILENSFLLQIIWIQKKIFFSKMI
ncbi:hypothetical protein COF60_25655 [Bacillus toyonensis]|nr:hypothetical protein COF60_25655 [Bacillus toyonensis]